MSHPRLAPVLRVLVACALVLAMGAASLGCQRTFVYRPDQLPPARQGRLETAPGQSWRIERVRVSHADSPSIFIPARRDDLEAIASGDPGDVDSIEVRVGTEEVVWRDWAVPGGIGGVVIGAMLGALVGGTALDDAGFGGEGRIIFAGLFGLAFGAYGLGGGAGIGALVESGHTDLRLDPGQTLPPARDNSDDEDGRSEAAEEVLPPAALE